MGKSIVITTLVENSVTSLGLRAEHGLAFLLRAGQRHLLFDTGQSRLLLDNAKTMGLSLAGIEAIVLSHGHYDHTGGLKAALEMAPNARIYAHSAAFNPKYTPFLEGGSRAIGTTGENVRAAQAPGPTLVWTAGPIEIFDGIFVTGPIPRANTFEDTGGRFFSDATCVQPDPLLDDQALYFDTRQGLVVLLGCGHSGVINTLDYIQRLSGNRPIHTVMGGFHLLSAGKERMTRTIEAFRGWDVQRIIPAHCTGLSATVQLWTAFPGRCSACPVGTTIPFEK